MYYEMRRLGSSKNFSAFKGENLNFPKHLHRFFQLMAIQSGELRVFIDGKTYNLHAGEMVLIFPNQLHSFDGENCEHKICIFTPELVSLFSKKVEKKYPENNKFIPGADLLQAVVDIDENSSPIYQKGLLYILCSVFDENAVYHDKKSDSSDVLLRILDYVEDHYSEDCSLERIAEEMAYSYQYLSRYFNSTMKMSFNAYVNLCRINKACYFLSNTEHSVLQCGLECGYKSLRSFNRNFKTYMKISPSEYRKQNNKTDEKKG